MHKEAHLHLAAVLCALETLGRQLDDPRAEEGEGHDFGVFELGAGDVARDDAALGECKVCVKTQVSKLVVHDGSLEGNTYLREQDLQARRDPFASRGPSSQPYRQ